MNPSGFYVHPYFSKKEPFRCKKPAKTIFAGFYPYKTGNLLDYQDSNLDKQNQNLLCYHYTIVQTYVLSVKKRCKDRGLQANLQIFYSLFYFAASQTGRYHFAISK